MINTTHQQPGQHWIFSVDNLGTDLDFNLLFTLGTNYMTCLSHASRNTYTVCHIV